VEYCLVLVPVLLVAGVGVLVIVAPSASVLIGVGVLVIVALSASVLIGVGVLVLLWTGALV
jgi:hypothetical protein